MENLRSRAEEIKEEIIKNRRAIHQFAEIGFDLPQTVAYVEEQLRSYGLDPQQCGKSGIVCTIGAKGKTILLRADMDALPLEETTGLDFAATNGNSHSCGHDAHTAMLLGAAKLLKEQEGELKGRVKLMFQPAEELLAGAMDMIDHGVLDNPKVDAAMALHITAGIPEAVSGVIYHKPKELTYSGDAVRIVIKGKDAHSSRPNLGIDAINIAAHIVVALNSMYAKEVSPVHPAVVSVGKISGGTAPNIVAGSAEIELSIRSATREYREILLKRVKEVAENMATVFGGKTEYYHEYGMPPMYNNEELGESITGYITELIGEEGVQLLTDISGTEDFAMISERVPSLRLLLGGGSLEEGYDYYMHNPSLKVNEDALPIGAAVYAHVAVRWLEENNR